ncbi:MAG: hypothetical protein WDO73_12960 [Ignavibacteriota bacterium]
MFDLLPDDVVKLQRRYDVANRLGDPVEPVGKQRIGMRDAGSGGP